MEQFGSISELNWSFSDESEDIMSQLFGATNHNTNMNEQDSIFWSNQEITACDMLNNHNSEAGSYNLLDNLSSFWSDTSNINTSSTCNFPYNPASEFQNHELGNTNAAPNTNSSKHCVSEEVMSQNDKNVLKCISIDTNSENIVLEKDCGIKKKARASSQVTKKEKSGKKAKKSEESINASCSSEDESNTSQELNDPTSSNAKGKTRACRGSATDPQSLYARKRRERINERLKILQTLVPNGTKVDISTMLEEAVQYVKFLQLQIKLLSSDELWMYAPLAYNGMDIGLDLKIHLPQQH